MTTTTFVPSVTPITADWLNDVNAITYNTGVYKLTGITLDTGARIKGDFSNATIADRVMFQTSTVNGATAVGAIGNGTSGNSSFSAFTGSDPNNASYIGLRALGAGETRIDSAFVGTGTYLPMTFYTGGSERMRIDASGNVLVTNAGGLGYGTGAGGTVTQATSRTTAVTLNKPTGQITMFSAAGSSSPASFVVNNSLVTASDTVVLSMRSGNSNVYNYQVNGLGAGTFGITFWTTGGTAVDAPVINFAIIKGATA